MKTKHVQTGLLIECRNLKDAKTIHDLLHSCSDKLRDAQGLDISKIELIYPKEV